MESEKSQPVPVKENKIKRRPRLTEEEKEFLRNFKQSPNFFTNFFYKFSLIKKWVKSNFCKLK